mmetsp:Transcript_25008/g.54830  ORF Transcript_25008/g.54830 Transcript_25008/m.54830 type:complete len:352 (-) Transcript_25008:101-1156(-)
MTKYGDNDGPLGKAPDISVGASDTLLLTVSFAGFCVLAWSVYSIVLTKLKTARELQDETEEQEISYDERLAQADVSTLNRAQRRARARHIMKQQRRVTPAATNNHQHVHPMEGEGGNEGQQNLLLEQQQQEQQHDEGIPPFQDDSHHANAQHLLSRKERQKAAKQVELQERRLLEGDRRKEQRKAQEAAISKRKEKERTKAIRVEHDRKEREEQRQADELTRYRAWKMFLENENASITVQEWILELKENRVIYLNDLADRFRVSESMVHDRIQELLNTSRVSGVMEKLSPSLLEPCDDDNKTSRENKCQSVFIYLLPEEMSELALYVKAQDKITAKDLAMRIEQFIPKLPS